MGKKEDSYDTQNETLAIDLRKEDVELPQDNETKDNSIPWKSNIRFEFLKHLKNLNIFGSLLKQHEHS